MLTVSLILALATGLAVGAVAAWLVARARGEAGTSAVRQELERVRETADERLALVAETRSTLEHTFKALSVDALRTNNESFLQLARTQLERFQTSAQQDLERRQTAVAELVRPIREQLEKVDGQVRNAESARRQAYGALGQQLTSLAESQERLRAETGNLVTALRAPHVRGRWGEVQLRKVVEHTGMLEHCDFELQASTRDVDGALLRPDLIVRLPGGKHVVVDAKVPLAAYLDACEAADDDARGRHLSDHARQVRDHVGKLSAKAYWRQFDPSPDFVVMFLPDETFLRAAQEQDRSLHEDAWRLNVIPASPTNLFALLRTIAAIWHQQTVAETAREVHGLGKELYERLGTMAGHFTRLGSQLDKAVSAYNETVGSLETRVLVTARKLESHGITGQLADPQPIERQSRPLQAVELTLEAGEALGELPPAREAA